MHVFYERRTSSAATCDRYMNVFLAHGGPRAASYNGYLSYGLSSTAIEIEKRPIPSALGS